MRDLAELERVVGHHFADSELLATALTHRSYANERREQAVSDNEKLEFLGDAVLDLVVGHRLMERFPELGEGDLSMTRAQVVSTSGLSAAARRLELGRWLRVGKGEERSGGREKASLLADAFEAVIAAVYLDGGFDVARDIALHLLGPDLDAVDADSRRDFKTRLQERVQADKLGTPAYRIVAETGPDHDKTFEVVVVVDGRELARAAGKTKKSAEQEAAARATAALDEE